MKRMIFRFDDIHPLMDKDSFEFIVSLAEECASSILICVIPDNKDLSLVKRNRPIKNFWTTLMTLESKGINIGLHGMHHVLHKSKKSILNVSKQSEYTGLSYDIQKKLISQGLNALRSKGLNPNFFAAPAHGFDKTSLRVLKELNFKNISDGYYPETCINYDLNWIPLKTWNPKTKFIGDHNTICIHLNRNNIEKVRKGIYEIVHKGHNISFNSIIKLSRKLRRRDHLINFLYSIAINVLFLKRSTIKFLKSIYNFLARTLY